MSKCPTCGRTKRRSNQQNARYWLLLNKISETIKPEGTSYGTEAWHLWFKARFIGVDDVRLPNKKIIVVPKSTADLDVDEFNEYMTKVEAWASERGVYLED